MLLPSLAQAQAQVGLSWLYSPFDETTHPPAHPISNKIQINKVLTPFLTYTAFEND